MVFLLAITLGADFLAPPTWQRGRGVVVNLLTESVGLVAALMIAVWWIDRRQRQEQERIRKAVVEELKVWRNCGWVVIVGAWQFLDSPPGLKEPAIGFYPELRDYWQDVVKTLDRPPQGGVHGPASRSGQLVCLEDIGTHSGWRALRLEGAIERSMRLYAPSLQAFPDILRVADQFLSLSKDFSMRVSQLKEQADRNKELLREASIRAALSGRLEPPLGPQDQWVLDPVVTPDVVDNYRQTAKAALHLVGLCEREIGEWMPPSQLSRASFGITRGGGLYLPKDYWLTRLHGNTGRPGYVE